MKGTHSREIPGKLNYETRYFCETRGNLKGTVKSIKF